LNDAHPVDRRAAQPQPWLKLAALLLVVAALGLPVNDLFRYALLVIATVLVVAGTVSAHVAPWLAALAAVALCVLGQVLFASPRIAEGHNVFLVDDAEVSAHSRESGNPGAAARDPGSPQRGPRDASVAGGPSRGRADRGSALEAGLPRAAFRLMAAEFDATYPPARRCARDQVGCWRGQSFPEQTFAFSADGIFDRAAYSRRVTGIDFSDPVRLRLGFINELGYNWNSQASDVIRAHRDRRSLAFLHQWTLAMPWFVLYRFPADFVGSALCWRGEVLWEGADGNFEPVTHADKQCRTLTAADVGRDIFGVAIAHELAMRLVPTWHVRLRQLVEPGLALIATAAALALLVRVRPRRVVLPFALIAVTLVVAMFNDASFLGGVRPFDSGDDGLVYDGYARMMLRQLIAGDVAGALKGVEPVFYFTPGLRYLRAAEHLIFGESYLGYLSLLLLLPFLVFALFRRFLPLRWALALIVVFAAVPVGVLFGSSLVQYVKWAARGFADPAAYIFFLAAFVLLLGPRTRSAPLPLVGRGWGWGSMSEGMVVHHRTTPLPSRPPTQVGLARLAQEKTRPGQARGAGGREQTEFAARADSAPHERTLDEGPRDRFDRAFGAGLLFALALFVRPNIAPAAGILLAGAGLAALAQRQYRRVAGLGAGFAAVLGMALHNWVYGGALVLFTTTAELPRLLVMPPSAYLAGGGAGARFYFARGHVARAMRQIAGWLAGPSEAIAMAPLNAAAILVLLRVALWRGADPWLRLTAFATLAQHGVALFYPGDGRYHYLTWLLTLLVVAAWVHGEGVAMLRRWFPRFSARAAKHPASLALARGLERMSEMLQR
jgi:hypothetical protein